MNLFSLIPIVAAIVAFVLGWLAGGGQYLIYLVPLALINTLVVSKWRMDQVRGRDGTGRANMIADGAFLMVLQLLILGFVYLLGFFLKNAVPLLSL